MLQPRTIVKFTTAVIAALACQGLAAPAIEPVPTGPVMEQVRQILQRDESKWIEFRHDLHRHPEVSGAETRTSQNVAAELRRLGLQVRTNVGGHGVVAILRGARPGPLVAYRADMDAVFSGDRDPAEYRSLTAGVRHVCGHDVHTTVALALASALQQARDSLAGSVMFIFQPAEERATGAKAMIADGVFTPERPVEIYGIHTSGQEQGRLATKAGPMMAGRDRFEVVLSGSGDLAAARATVAARINALGTVDPSQFTSMQPPDFVMVQMNPPQVNANETRLSGMISIATVASRARVASAIRTGLGASLPSGVTVISTYEEKWIAGVTNDSTRSVTAANSIRAELGDAAMVNLTTIPAGFSEDFGSFQDVVPGVFFYLGVSNTAKGWIGYPHSPDYVADDQAIRVGARAMASVIVDRLRVR